METKNNAKLNLVKSAQGFAPVILLVIVALVISIVSILAYILMKGFWINELTFEEAQKIAPYSSPPQNTDTSTSDETANWETYVNQDFGFSFKHPFLTNKGSIIGPETGNAKLIRMFAKEDTMLMGSDAPFDGFALYIADSNNLQDFVSKEKVSLGATYESFANKEPSGVEKKLTVDGIDAVLLQDYSLWGLEYIYIPFNKTGEIIVLSKLNKDKESFEPIFKQILSTFRFLD